EDRQPAADLLAGFVEVLRTTLKSIAATGAEDAGAIAEFRVRPTVERATDPEPRASDPEETEAGSVESAPGFEEPGDIVRPNVEEIVQELQRFFAENGDALSYFATEAAEHLDVMTEAMLALERHESPGGAVATLLRAAHTLKGAAYTVGCHAVGDLAHRLEELLVQLRDGHISLGPAVVDGVAVGIAALRAMTTPDTSMRERLPHVLQRALAVLPSREGDAPAMPREASTDEPDAAAA